ncbi:MerR family transcriptional regulator [Bacteriovorax sp. Seq25_V]|uniref:MerR family transcriptional regulator n=1 Tax=Bacteriovorax sp. Seq25_V TaxID=1201288 RepID=UPI000389FCAF|nr:MerR family transcriptional regulator [Bacteriovorax sp. Seq25_V]EQC46194.1 MerR HTH family regulatory protein [Bacteriovorax sp. Seq25_V]
MQSEIRIPNKSLFKLDEVCSITGVKPYVLRFWETEFEEISPMVSSTGQKLFEHKDIESILMVKELLFNQKLTIEQAKNSLKDSLSHIVTHLETDDQLQAQDLSRPQLKMELDGRDLKKLVDAKDAMSKILLRAKTIKGKHNWA